MSAEPTNTEAPSGGGCRLRARPGPRKGPPACQHRHDCQHDRGGAARGRQAHRGGRGTRRSWMPPTLRKLPMARTPRTPASAAPTKPKEELTDEDIRLLPIRQYLEHTVVGVVMQGMQQICRKRPEDPDLLLVRLYVEEQPEGRGRQRTPREMMSDEGPTHTGRPGRHARRAGIILQQLCQLIYHHNDEVAARVHEQRVRQRPEQVGALELRSRPWGAASPAASSSWPRRHSLLGLVSPT